MKTILEKKFELALGFNTPPLGQLKKTKSKMKNSFFGMNAVLWVGVTGPVIERTGFIIEIAQFKQVLKKKVIEKYDHHFFDGLSEKEVFLNLIKDIKNCISNCFSGLLLHHLHFISPFGIEYIYNGYEPSIKIKMLLSDRLKSKKSLVIDYDKSNKHVLSDSISDISDNSIKQPSEKFSSISEELDYLDNQFDGLSFLKLSYDNESIDNQRNQFQFSITSFSGVHQLVNKNMSDTELTQIFGKCATLHGHDFILKVVVKGSDSGTKLELKKVIDLIDSELNGQNFNEVSIFKNSVCTCENMLHYIWQYIEKISKIKLQSLRLTETFNNRFIITR